MKNVYKLKMTFVLLLLVMAGGRVMAAAPIVVTGSSTPTMSGATLNATVDPNGANVTSIYFEYGKTSGYGSNVIGTPYTITAGSGATSVSATLVGLAPNTVYYYRIAAVNSAGTSYGTGSSFTTDNGVSTNNVQNITATTGDVYYTARGVGSFTDRGIWYGTVDTPPGSEGSTGWHSSGGVPSQTITDTGTYYKTTGTLVTGTVYYACGYVTIGGVKQYGEVIPFIPGSTAPVTYSCKMRDFQQVDAFTFQFKVYIMQTGGTLLYLNNFQIGMETNNSDWLQDTYMTGAYIGDGIPGLTPGGVTVAYQASGTSGHLYNHMDVRINGTPPTSNGYLISASDPGTCIGTFQLKNWTDATHTTPKAFGSIPMRIERDDDFIAKTYIYAIVPPGGTGTRVLITNIYQHTSAADNSALNAANWNGISSTDWNTAANWTMNPTATAAVPTSTVNAYIPGTGSGITNYPVVSIAMDRACNTLYIEDGAQTTISSDGGLTVSGNLWLGTTASSPLVIKSASGGTGSFINNGTITGTVSGLANVNIERYITGAPVQDGATKYHLVSHPFSGNYLSGVWMDSYLFDCDETIGNWIPNGTSTTTSLLATKGYMIYYPAASKLYSHTGTLQTGVSTIPVTKTGTGLYAGYNLVPNLYTSALDFDLNAAHWGGGVISNKIWFWNSTLGNYGSHIRNGANTNSVSNIIPEGQAFFVEASASGNLTVDPAARVHNSSQGFLKNSDNVPNTFSLKVNANNFGDEIVIQFRDDATTGYDKPIEAIKMTGQIEAPQLSSLTSDEIELSINSLPFTGSEIVVNLNYTLNASTNSTFIASGMESFDVNTPIYLEDVTLKKLVNLRTSPVYTFSHDPSQPADRFKLHFAGTIGMNDLTAVEGNAFISNGSLFIDVPTMIGQTTEISIYNTLGQLLHSEKVTLNGIARIDAPQNSGVFVVHASSSTNHFITKVLNK